MPIQQRLPRYVQPLILFVLLCFSQLGNTAQPPVIMVLGDSLSAAYGINEKQGWVALLQQKLQHEDYPHQVINISISGDTTQGGLSRLPAALKQHQPNVLIIALGANDGLRGNSMKQLRENLSAMIDLAKQQQIKVLLVGMELPPNYGTNFNQRFRDSFAEVAKQHQVPLLPFLLERIALQRTFFQQDGLHPTAEAQPQLLQSIWSHLQPVL